MKHMKKLALLGLTAAFSLSLLAGCGGGGTGTSDSPAPNESAPVEESSEPSAETPAAGGNTVTSDYGDFTVVEAGKLHMSTNAAFPPYEMTTDDGGFVFGIHVAIGGYKLPQPFKLAHIFSTHEPSADKTKSHRFSAIFTLGKF